MHSYSIYTGISHVNQLTKLHPELIRKIRLELDEIAERFGGRSTDQESYIFPPSIGETARKAAEAAEAMHRWLRRNERELFGTTVLLAPAGDHGGPHPQLESFILRVPDEDGLWLMPELRGDFESYFVLTDAQGLLRVDSLKEAGLRLEERLPKLLVRPDRLNVVRQALEALEREENDRTVLLLRGRPGAGKRATLKEALRKLYPDDGGAPLVIPFSAEDENPMEPFVRALGPAPVSIAEYLDDEEARWWTNEGEGLIDSARRGRIWDKAGDQEPVDLIQAFALFVKALLERRRQGRRPAYLIVDGFLPESEAVSWLRSLVTEFLDRDGFRLILIRDSDDFDEALPLPGKGHEVGFRRPGPEEWEAIVREAAVNDDLENLDFDDLAESCGASLYRLFHALLARESGADSGVDPGESLVVGLDGPTRRTLFLVHAAAGLADRHILIDRLPSEEEKAQEGARYDGLVALGLIREDPDGRIRGIPGGPAKGFAKDLENIREAEVFGEYLYQRHMSGKPLDLFRLFRYLERWGPVNRGIDVLDRLLESLLTRRRLRAAGLLLNGPPMSLSDLHGPDMESLQNVVGAARLRYVLLTGDAEGARNLVRDGTVSLVSGRGAYSERFRLHNALFSYAAGRWDEALAASKEALFVFQKSGDHEGETHAHLELALALLALGKVRDAQEHFGIARRIGAQINAVWGILRASAMESVAQFLFGNLSRALRECREFRLPAHREGRRDLWLLLTLVATRISWDLGRYDDVVSYAEEGRRVAGFYSLSDEYRVLTIWKGRGLLGRKDAEGRMMLEAIVDEEENPGRREALAFLAEDAWFTGRPEEARRLIGRARNEERRSVRLQGEADDWSDGFYPIEGRLADSSGPLDVLGEWIRGFDAYLSAQNRDENAVLRLDSLLEQDGRRIPRPFSYQYALWASLAIAEGERESQTRYLSRAFNDLQTRAGRFDDNQTKHAWLTANPWNKLLMEEAQRRKFL